MRLWSSGLLEEELAKRYLSEWEKVKYLLLPAVVGTLLGGPIFLLRPIAIAFVYP